MLHTIKWYGFGFLGGKDTRARWRRSWRNQFEKHWFLQIRRRWDFNYTIGRMLRVDSVQFDANRYFEIHQRDTNAWDNATYVLPGDRQITVGINDIVYVIKEENANNDHGVRYTKRTILRRARMYEQPNFITIANNGDRGYHPRQVA